MLLSKKKKRFHLELNATEFKCVEGNYQKKKEFTVSLKFNFDIHIIVQ